MQSYLWIDLGNFDLFHGGANNGIPGSSPAELGYDPNFFWQSRLVGIGSGRGWLGSTEAKIPKLNWKMAFLPDKEAKEFVSKSMRFGTYFNDESDLTLYSPLSDRDWVAAILKGSPHPALKILLEPEIGSEGVRAERWKVDSYRIAPSIGAFDLE